MRLKIANYRIIFQKTAFVRLNGNKLILPYSNTFRKTHKPVEIRIPPILADKKIKEIRIIPKPKARFFEIQYTYEAECIQRNLNKSNALTLDFGVNNLVTANTSSFEVRLSSYNSTKINDNQIWEVIPCENSTNIVIRSKYLDSNASLAKSYYLSLDESSNALICKTDEKQKFNISNPTYNWKRFGEIYLSYIGFPEVNQQPESLYFSLMYYYRQNIRNGIGNSNIKPSDISNYNVLYNQSEGSFTKCLILLVK